MSVESDSLRKIIDLEAKKGCIDSAVIGGLDKFLRNWSVQAAASLSSPKLLRQFKKLKLEKAGYAAMPQERRQEWLNSLLAFLNEAETESGPAVKPPAKKTAGHQKPKSSPTALHSITGGGIDAPVTVIPGIREAVAKKFARLGVKTVRDLLYFFPHRHFDYSKRKTISQLGEGKEETIVANVWETRITMPGGRRSTEAVVGDETGNIRVVWFNNPYVAKSLKANTRVMLSGRVGNFNGRHVFQSPEWEVLEDKELIHTGRLVPLYHLTAGLGSRQVRKLMKSVVDNWAGKAVDFLPAGLKERRKLLELPRAISQAHFPDDETLKDRARLRLAFDDLLLLQLGVLAKKRQWQVGQPGHPFIVDDAILEKFMKTLPFKLTNAQNRVLKEILVDLEKKLPMSRLLQGEVGSGKTVVAAAALLTAAANGFQSALMAPTEILAGQHFKTIFNLLSNPSLSKGTLSIKPGIVKSDALVCHPGVLPLKDEGSQGGALPPFVCTGSLDPSVNSEIGTAVPLGKSDSTVSLSRKVPPSVIPAEAGIQPSLNAEGESRPSLYRKEGLEGDFSGTEGNLKDSCLFTFTGVLPRSLTVALLTGDMSAAKKRELQQLIKEGKVDIVVGTHALIQKDVSFQKLGLAVIDEQHRFGVAQRSALRQQGFNPHMLVMTATPIPRTLALTLYGDLDLSVIDELPPGRQVVRTKWLKPEQRDSAYAFIRKQISEGRQGFIICPLVEESETVQARAALAEYERLSREVLPDLKLALLHGRMSAVEKDDVMRAFSCGETDILVATPVVEVGIDVPNATVMLVESADRFGLSQLHQFRGRVGRGKEQSYCMLLAEEPSEEGRERLKVIETTFDGFKLAEEDLKLRGPGEFFGTRQSGLPDLRMARLSDVAILELARTEATRLFAEDPKLKNPEHALLVKELARVWPDFEAGEWS